VVNVVNLSQIAISQPEHFSVHPHGNALAVDDSIADCVHIIALAVRLCLPAPFTQPGEIIVVDKRETMIVDGMSTVQFNSFHFDWTRASEL